MRVAGCGMRDTGCGMRDCEIWDAELVTILFNFLNSHNMVANENIFLNGHNIVSK